MAIFFSTRLYQSVLAHKKFLFWIFLAGTVITGYLQILQNKELINETAPKGIITLELENDHDKDTAIVASWKLIRIQDSSYAAECQLPAATNLLGAAKQNVFMDFLFIFFYTGLLLIAIIRLQEPLSPRKKRFTVILLGLAILAAGMDVAEDIGMLGYIDAAGTIPMPRPVIPAFLISLAAYIKFILLIFLVLLYIPFVLITRRQAFQTLSTILTHRIRQVHQYRVIFLGLLGFAIPIWILDQGQDLLINSNGSNLAVIIFLFAVIALAFVNWYLAKLFFRHLKPGEKIFPLQDPVLEDPVLALQEKKVSRFLGVLTFLIPATAILNVLQITHIPYTGDEFPAIAALALIGSIFYLLIRFDFVSSLFMKAVKAGKKRRAKLIAVAVIVLMIVLVPVLLGLFRGKNIHNAGSLIYLYWHLVSLALAFYVFVSIRTLVFDKNGWFGQNVGKLILFIAIIPSLAFLFVNFNPLSLISWEGFYITLPLLICGAIFYIFAFTLLMRLSQKLKVNFVSFIFIIGLTLSFVNTNNYHEANLKEYRKAKPLPEMETYFKQWVLNRKDEIMQDSIYPVFLVNTYGGGIKAAAFTSMVFSYLDNNFVKAGYRHFGHYTFSISGASGGTIGAAMHCAYWHQTRGSAPVDISKEFMSFYQHDFLSALLVTDMGRDVWASAISANWWADRAEVGESTWERLASRYLSLDLNKEYNSLWDTSASTIPYQVPLLFSNTLNVDNGLKGICAAVHLKKIDFPATIFINDRLDAINEHRPLEDTMRKGLSLMTGAFLSARFPFISPGGKLGPGYHFIDGGGKDNSGASTSEQIFGALTRYADSSTTNIDSTDILFKKLVKKIRFYFISINHSPRRIEPRKLVENRIEIISPVIGIVNSGIDGNARAADSTLAARYGDLNIRHQQFYTGYFPIFPTAYCIQEGEGKPFTPVLPLGWQISSGALKRLQATFSQDPHGTEARQSALFRVIDLMKPVRKEN